MKRILTLAAILSAVWASNARADELSALKAEVEALKERVEAIENETAGARPIVVSPPISDDLPSEIRGDVEIGFSGCESDPSVVSCGLILNTLVDQQIFLYPKESRIILGDGSTLNGSFVAYGSEAHEIFEAKLIQDAPILIHFHFDKSGSLNSSATVFEVVGGSIVEPVRFRNVAIRKSNTPIARPKPIRVEEEE